MQVLFYQNWKFKWCKIHYERLDPQKQNYKFKFYDKHKVCGKWIQPINKIDKQSKPIKITSIAENKRQR